MALLSSFCETACVLNNAAIARHMLLASNTRANKQKLGV
jgi:hypothetical protein